MAFARTLALVLALHVSTTAATAAAGSSKDNAYKITATADTCTGAMDGRLNGYIQWNSDFPDGYTALTDKMTHKLDTTLEGQGKVETANVVATATKTITDVKLTAGKRLIVGQVVTGTGIPFGATVATARNAEDTPTAQNLVLDTDIPAGTTVSGTLQFGGIGKFIHITNDGTNYQIQDIKAGAGAAAVTLFTAPCAGTPAVCNLEPPTGATWTPVADKACAGKAIPVSGGITAVDFAADATNDKTKCYKLTAGTAGACTGNNAAGNPFKDVSSGVQVFNQMAGAFANPFGNEIAMYCRSQTILLPQCAFSDVSKATTTIVDDDAELLFVSQPCDATGKFCGYNPPSVPDTVIFGSPTSACGNSNVAAAAAVTTDTTIELAATAAVTAKAGEAIVKVDASTGVMTAIGIVKADKDIPAPGVAEAFIATAVATATGGEVNVKVIPTNTVAATVPAGLTVVTTATPPVILGTVKTTTTVASPPVFLAKATVAASGASITLINTGQTDLTVPTAAAILSINPTTGAPVVHGATSEQQTITKPNIMVATAAAAAGATAVNVFLNPALCTNPATTVTVVAGSVVLSAAPALLGAAAGTPTIGCAPGAQVKTTAAEVGDTSITLANSEITGATTATIFVVNGVTGAMTPIGKVAASVGDTIALSGGAAIAVTGLDGTGGLAAAVAIDDYVFFVIGTDLPVNALAAAVAPFDVLLNSAGTAIATAPGLATGVTAAGAYIVAAEASLGTDVPITILAANVAKHASLAIPGARGGTAVTVTKLDGTTDGLETTVAVGDIIGTSKTLTIAEAPCPAPPASGASSVSATAFSLVAVLAAAAGFMLA